MHLHAFRECDESEIRDKNSRIMDDEQFKKRIKMTYEQKERLNDRKS